MGGGLKGGAGVNKNADLARQTVLQPQLARCAAGKFGDCLGQLIEAGYGLTETAGIGNFFAQTVRANGENRLAKLRLGKGYVLQGQPQTEQ